MILTSENRFPNIRIIMKTCYLWEISFHNSLSLGYTLQKCLMKYFHCHELEVGTPPCPNNCEAMSPVDIYLSPESWGVDFDLDIV